VFCPYLLSNIMFCFCFYWYLLLVEVFSMKVWVQCSSFMSYGAVLSVYNRECKHHWCRVACSTRYIHIQLAVPSTSQGTLPYIYIQTTRRKPDQIHQSTDSFSCFYTKKSLKKLPYCVPDELFMRGSCTFSTHFCITQAHVISEELCGQPHLVLLCYLLLLTDRTY
jgi:hypothetical protein